MSDSLVNDIAYGCDKTLKNDTKQPNYLHTNDWKVCINQEQSSSQQGGACTNCRV